MKRVERPHDLDLEACLLFGLSIYRAQGRLALPHSSAANLPFTGSVIFVAASLQEEHVTVALDEKGHDDQESSAPLGLVIRQRTVAHGR
jgi:hypothetical protein